MPSQSECQTLLMNQMPSHTGSLELLNNTIVLAKATSGLSCAGCNAQQALIDSRINLRDLVTRSGASLWLLNGPGTLRRGLITGLNLDFCEQDQIGNLNRKLNLGKQGPAAPEQQETCRACAAREQQKPRQRAPPLVRKAGWRRGQCRQG